MNTYKPIQIKKFLWFELWEGFPSKGVIPLYARNYELFYCVRPTLSFKLTLLSAIILLYFWVDSPIGY